MDCAVTFHSIADGLSSFEMATYTGVDGIAAFIYEKTDRIADILKRIADAGIPVVQMKVKLLKAEHIFIGTNSFDSGKA